MGSSNLSRDVRFHIGRDSTCGVAQCALLGLVDDGRVDPEDIGIDGSRKRVTVSVIDKRARLLWRIDAKLDLLLKPFGIDFDPHNSLPHEVVDAMQRGEKIRAIKYYRDATGAPLKDAKVFIEEAERRLNLS